VLGAIVAAGVVLAIVASRKGGYDAGSDGLGANGSARIRRGIS
jgi:hypothetical protein